MPRGIPKKGYRLTKKINSTSLEDIEKQLARRVPDIISELQKLTKPIPCPHCGNEVRFIDKDVGMYLVDRVMGRPKQKTEVDITQSIQLTADQVDLLIHRYEIAQRALLGPVIEGEVHETDNSQTACQTSQPARDMVAL
jgi:hypothetical protein